MCLLCSIRSEAVWQKWELGVLCAILAFVRDWPYEAHLVTSPLFCSGPQSRELFNIHHPPQAHILEMLWTLMKPWRQVRKSHRTIGPIQRRAKCFFLVDRRTTVWRQVLESQNLRPEREHRGYLVQLSFEVHMQLVEVPSEQRWNWDPGVWTTGPCSLPHIVQLPQTGELCKDIL